MSKFEIGTLCKVKNQNIIGVIKENYGKSVVIIDKDSEGNLKGILYHNFTPILLKAIQELKAKNDALEARVLALESA